MNDLSEKVEGLSELVRKYGAEEQESTIPEGFYSVSRALKRIKIFFSIDGKSFCIKRPVGPDAHIHTIKDELCQLGLSKAK